MARISSNVLQGLSSPSFAQGMFTAGAALGGIPGQLKEKQKRDQFNKIMKRGQALLASAEPDPVELSGVAQELQALGYTKEAEQFANASRKRGEQAAQRARVGGLLTQAASPEGITSEYAKDFIGQGGTLEQLTAGREAAKTFDEPLREQGRGRLRQMARSKFFDDQDPSQMQGYRNVAKRFKITENEAAQILAKERGTRFERAKLANTAAGRAGTTTFSGLDNYIDKRDLEYKLTEVRDPTGQGKIRIEYKPVGHEIPYAFSYEDEEGNIVENRLDALGGAYEETALARSARRKKEETAEAQIDITKAVTIEEAKDFNKQKIKAAERLPVVNQTLEKVDAMLQIVDGLNTGSTLDQMMDLVQTALGYRETDLGVFETLSKELIVGSIKSYGSNPSDGERIAVQSMLPNIQNTPGINREILEMTRGRLVKERAAINYMQQEGMSLEQYVKFVDSLYPTEEDGVDPATGNKVVDFNDI